MEAELNAAATKLQKFYKSYRTRRNLADCAVVVEELWWKALEFAALRRSSVSFFNSNKSETAVSRWARARTRAAKVGKGLSKAVKGQRLALRHWLEAIDPHHRYGHNLHFYYDVWFESKSSQPFFYWLDVGDGKAVTLDKCPRTVLQSQCIKYLGPVIYLPSAPALYIETCNDFNIFVLQKERESYQVMMEEGKLIYKQNKEAVNTREGSKWIFVLSTCRILYVGEKVKGEFHHSSFLAGGATIASGRLVVRQGTLYVCFQCSHQRLHVFDLCSTSIYVKPGFHFWCFFFQAVWAYSGHYRPTQENFMELCSFLEKHHVDLTDVKKYPIDDDIPREIKEAKQPETSENTSFIHAKEMSCIGKEESGEDRSSRGVNLRYKWSTGVGHRIVCVRDYPAQLQFKALEHVNLSPRLNPGFGFPPIPSPRPTPKLHLSPRLAYLGLVSPRVRLQAAN
ncbi:U-box domain-containing protein 34-like [Hibiscus syriacus]|uniref:U-box domain-containing protein 34-like n=1 Tax=Hibiscus syriacus TaxID=106335 RepID=A0A6A3BDM6_HIBSY|nr:U-box domain-containing protein 34-like [Hibiscus syriacus]